MTWLEINITENLMDKSSHSPVTELLAASLFIDVSGEVQGCSSLLKAPVYKKGNWSLNPITVQPKYQVSSLSRNFSGS